MSIALRYIECNNVYEHYHGAFGVTAVCVSTPAVEYVASQPWTSHIKVCTDVKVKRAARLSIFWNW